MGAGTLFVSERFNWVLTRDGVRCARAARPDFPLARYKMHKRPEPVFVIDHIEEKPTDN